MTGEALRTCVTHEWKGNVRELRSAVEQALLLAPGPEIDTPDLFNTSSDAPPNIAELDSGPVNSSASSLSFREAKERTVAAFERTFLLEALRRHGGNITKAAEEVGMYRQNFQQKMRELGISVDKNES
jgi:DNA-binding NtrC family response regulator